MFGPLFKPLRILIARENDPAHVEGSLALYTIKNNEPTARNALLKIHATLKCIPEKALVSLFHLQTLRVLHAKRATSLLDAASEYFCRPNRKISLSVFQQSGTGYEKCSFGKRFRSTELFLDRLRLTHAARKFKSLLINDVGSNCDIAS